MRRQLLSTILCLVAIYPLYSQSVCTKTRNISCDSPIKDSTDFETNIIENYQCGEGAFPGKERVYKFTLLEQRNIAINLQILDAGVDLDLFLLNSCNLTASSCVAYSTSFEGKEFIAQSLDAGVYYIVVDAKQANAVGTYRLRLTCVDNICQRSISSISCGEYKFKENITDARNLIDEYPGCGNKVYSGREMVYQLNVGSDFSIQVGLHVDTSSKKDFDLFLVKVDETCYDITCLAQAAPSAIKGSKYLFSGQQGSGTYYLIVDSQDFYTSGEFSIDVSCADLPCNSVSALQCQEPLVGTTTTAAKDRSKVSLYRVRQSGVADKYYPGHSGPEKMYIFDVLAPQNVTLTLSQTAEVKNVDLSLFVLKSCDKLDAVAGSETRGKGTKSLTVFLNPGTYYAVVDQFLGADAYKFSLDIQFAQACSNICDYGGAFISRGTVFSNELSASEPAPVLLYGEQCVKDAFALSPISGKQLFADVFVLNNEEAQNPIVLNLNAGTGAQNTRGLVFRCDSTAKTTCLGATENGILDLGPSPAGFYYVVILGTQNVAYTFSITPKGPCESNPEAIPLNTTLNRSVKGMKNDFSASGSGFNGYNACYNGSRTYQGEDMAFQFTIPSNVLATISLSSNAPMGLFLYAYSCGKGCLDFAQTSISGGTGEITDFPLSPGTYYLIVDQNDPTSSGEFSIRINTRAANTPPFFLPYDPLNAVCIQSKRKGHTLEINKKGTSSQLTASDKLYFFPDQLSPQARATEVFWDPSPSPDKFKVDGLKMDSLGDAQKCGFRDRDSIYIVLETNDKDQQFIQEIRPEYVVPSASNGVTAKGAFTPGGLSLIQSFRFVRPRHFALSAQQMIVNPNEDVIQSIAIKTNVRFRIKMEPAVDYIRILNQHSIYPAETGEIKVLITKNTSGKARDQVKLVFTSLTSPEFRREFLIKEKPCIPFTASIAASAATTVCPGASLTLSASTNLGSTSDYVYAWSNGSSSNSIDLSNLKTGSSTYTLTLTPKNESQCELKPLTQTINVLARPNAPIALKSEVGVCLGQFNPLLAVLPADGISTNWYNSANELLPAVDASHFLPKDKEAGMHTYYVEAQSSAGCISENRTPITLSIYPSFTLAGNAVEKNVSCKGGNDGVLNIKLNEPGFSNLSYNWSDSGTGNPRTGLKAGLYTVTLSGGSGCSQQFSATITEPDSIRIVVKSIKADTSSKNKGSIEVTLSGGSLPYRYQWTKDGQAFSTSQNLVNAGAGNYQLKVTDQNQCVRSSSILKISNVVVSSSVEQAWSSRVTVFPNPTEGLINISFDLPQSLQVSPEILNARGETVQRLPTQTLAKGIIRTQIKDFGAGIYFVKMVFPEGALVKKVLLRH